jgi:hypothetical protein
MRNKPMKHNPAFKLGASISIALTMIVCTFLLSCEKPFWANDPKADFTMTAGYVYSQDGPAIVTSEGDTLACCYDNLIDSRSSQNAFRKQIRYRCVNGLTSTLAPHDNPNIPDTIFWTQPGRYWIELTVWNDDGKSNKILKYFNVR